MTPRSWRLAGAAPALAMLASCGGAPLDLDLREAAGAFSTAEAAQAAPARPAPDARGVISYPGYQVVVAQADDTVAGIAGRLGFDAATLAAYNGLDPAATLRRDEIVALPSRVAEPAARAPAAPVVPVAAPAASAPVATTTLAAAPAAAPAPAPAGSEPAQHRVAAGETAYSVARTYGVPVQALADWNGLGTDLALREGQVLLIPPASPAAAPAPAPLPGQGSATPVPPSAAAPLPQEAPPEAAAAAPAPLDLGAEQSEAAASAMALPAQGPIIRAYAPGRNEGIDIGAPEGAQVRAAASGTVAAVTTNTEGVQIVVVRHDGDLLTVYTNLDRLTVAKDDRVARGEAIGQVRAGDPSFLHFEVRRGMDSVDPAEFLP